jgi:Fructose-bisphosphate aldolase class-II
VPLWALGPGSKFPGMHYAVFPGNVGDDSALTRVVTKFGGRRLITKPDPSSKSQGDLDAGASTKASGRSAEVGRGNGPIIRSRTNESSSMINLLKDYQQKGKAVAAFNVYNLEGAKAVITAAQRMNAPVILQVSEAYLTLELSCII